MGQRGVSGKEMQNHFTRILNQAQLLPQRWSSNKVLLWPITYMQAHIAGRLLCDVNAVFLLFTFQICDRR